LQIEQNGRRMHEHCTRQAITQIPEITRPHALGIAAVSQLAEDSSNAIAHAPQYCAPIVSRCMGGGAKWSKQTADPKAQPVEEAKKPGGAISQESACEALTAIGQSKLTDRHRERIHDGHTGVKALQTVTYQTLDAFLGRPQIGCLPDKRHAVDALHAGKEVRPMPLEVQEEFLVLGQLQIRSHNLHFSIIDAYIFIFSIRSGYLTVLVHGWLLLLSYVLYAIRARSFGSGNQKGEK